MRTLRHLLLLVPLALVACGDETAPDVTAKAPAPTWDRVTIPATPKDADVLLHLAAYPGMETVQVEGVSRTPKFGEYMLEQAEKILSDAVARPWTVARLETALAEATHPESPELEDEARRAALVYLLGASRDARVLPIVGAALGDRQLEVRVQATEVILRYWSGDLPEGGTEQAMEAAATWWAARRK